MEYINKCNQSVFLPFYTLFENNKWIINESKYSESYNYDGLRNPIKENIKFALIDEQNNLCCYCMKHLEKNDSSTIEHLYPHNPQFYNIFENYSITCIEKVNFNYSSRNIPNPDLDNLPHDLSYYNFIACCSNCNGNRGTKEIKPFVFDPDVKSKFTYDNNGNIYSVEYLDEIYKIGLATEHYVNYRRLWKELYLGHPNFHLYILDKQKKVIKEVALKLFTSTNILFYLNFSNNGLLVLKTMDYIYFYNN
ncbi:hypothetical protein OBK27_13025 [Empedobacter falsenii]